MANNVWFSGGKRVEGRGWERSEDYDAVLNNIGTPKETIDSMSYEFKEYI